MEGDEEGEEGEEGGWDVDDDLVLPADLVSSTSSTCVTLCISD